MQLLFIWGLAVLFSGFNSSGDKLTVHNCNHLRQGSEFGMDSKDAMTDIRISYMICTEHNKGKDGNSEYGDKVHSVSDKDGPSVPDDDKNIVKDLLSNLKPNTTLHIRFVQANDTLPSELFKGHFRFYEVPHRIREALGINDSHFIVAIADDLKSTLYHCLCVEEDLESFFFSKLPISTAGYTFRDLLIASSISAMIGAGVVGIVISKLLVRFKAENEILGSRKKSGIFTRDLDTTTSSLATVANDTHALFPSKGWHLKKSDIDIDKRSILGIGNFGIVYKGHAFDETVAVAVKVPHPKAGQELLLDLLTEVKIMALAESHDNGLGLVGAYVKEISKGILYLVTEYCEMGNLLAYLRQIKSKIFPQGQTEMIWNVEYSILIKFSFEIASGMDHLAKKCIVHGDLAARNEFLTDCLQCKIGDFGLSKKIYEGQKCDVSSTHFAWKWMPLETLQRMEMSPKSDVWSYGVLLWEIFTLGDVPYPGVSWTAEFANRMQQGLRLWKPTIASPPIFDLMLECWNTEPDDRPDFGRIANFFQSLREVEYVNIEDKSSRDRH